MNTLFDHLKRCWKGEESLCRVFWFWGAFVGSLLMLLLISYLVPALSGLLSLLEMLRMTTEEAQMQGFTPELLNRAEMMQVFEVLPLPFVLGAWATYFVWHFVSVWRAACSCPMGRTVARVVYVLFTIAYLAVVGYAACHMLQPMPLITPMN